jgi:hypothetical protein
MELWTWPFALQVSLGAGYLGYVTAYAGLRKHHTQTDIALITLAFSLPAAIPHLGGTPLAPVLSVALALMLSLGTAILWRHKGKSLWLRLMRWSETHAEDGSPDCWSALLQTPRLTVSQISVHTTDGRILYQNDHTSHAAAPEGGLLLGSDGSILMVVEEEELPDGTEEVRTGIKGEFGTRMTYVPASQIVRVNIRY